MSHTSSAIPEANLIPIIKTHFLVRVKSKESNYRDYSIGEEFRSQYGIPDILFYNFNNKVIQKRLDKNIEPVLSKEIIKTLLLIRDKKKISLSFLQENLPFNKETIQHKVIRYLLQKNYLNKSINNCDAFWVGEIIYETCMNDMYAIEAKVSNWKRGFYQAYRYKWFSNYSFLALHKDYIKPAIVNIKLFEQYNIGLMAVDTNESGIEVFYKPKKGKPNSKEMAALTYEKLFASYCEKKATSQSAQSSDLII